MHATHCPQPQILNYANNSSRAEALLEELDAIPSTWLTQVQPRFTAIQADVGDKASLQRLVKEVISQFGQLDVVISNAGWTRITDFSNLEEGVEDEDWDLCFKYNVKAHLWLFHAAKEELEKSEGSFVTTASIAGVCLSPGCAWT